MNGEGLLWRARLMRRKVRRGLQHLRFGSLDKSPIFFANSFPKSGTHLLTQVLRALSEVGPAVDSGLPAVVTFDGFSGRKRSEEEILRDLNRFQAGDIGYGHVHALPAAVSLLVSPRFATFFLVRDPRDVVVSHVYYVTEMAPHHVHHRYYCEVLHTFEERLSASIAGVPKEELQRVSGGQPVYEALPNIRQRFEPYLPWLEKNEVFVLRFEDFWNDRRQVLRRVLDFAEQRGFTLCIEREAALERLERAINPQRSPTFRRGAVGEWQTVFREEHRALFRAVAGDLLGRMGYE